MTRRRVSLDPTSGVASRHVPQHGGEVIGKPPRWRLGHPRGGVRSRVASGSERAGRGGRSDAGASSGDPIPSGSRLSRAPHGDPRRRSPARGAPRGPNPREPRAAGPRRRELWESSGCQFERRFARGSTFALKLESGHEVFTLGRAPPPRSHPDFSENRLPRWCVSLTYRDRPARLLQSQLTRSRSPHAPADTLRPLLFRPRLCR